MSEVRDDATVGADAQIDAVATASTGGGRRFRFSDYGIIWVTLLLFVLLWQTSDAFFTGANLRNVLDQQSLILIAASALTLTLIGGNFDISLSATYINASIVTALVMNDTGSPVLALAAGTAIGLVFGLVNGLIVSYVQINSFIATLATSFVFYGIGFLISDRSIVRVEDRGFADIARGRDFVLTNATWIAIVVVAFFWFVLERTRFGRHVFAAGGNPEAARLAGVRVEAVVTTTFVLAGAAAGLAGGLLASRTITAQPSDDFSFVFAVLTAVIIGGTSIAGGEGAVWRTIFGAFFIALLTNGFNLHQIDPIIQRLIQGSVILAAVAADNWTRTRRAT
ncbi:MAG: ABC transporter permease [Actinomycetota bacterium]